MFWRFIVLFLLIPSIYGVFGWYIAEEARDWAEWMIDRSLELELTVTVENLDLGIYSLAALLVALIALALTLLGEQMGIIFRSWFQTDTKAIISILGWSFAIVFFLRWFGDFARFLLLLAAAILGRLELQEAGYNRWQIFLVLCLLCFSSFIIGIWAHDIWGNYFNDLR